MSYGYFSNDDGVCADPDTVFQGGCACAWASAGGSDGDSLCNVDVGPEDCVGADDYAAEVANVEPRADAGSRRDVKAVLEAVMVKEDSVVDIGEDAKGFLFVAVKGDLAKIVRETKAGIAKVG